MKFSRDVAGDLLLNIMGDLGYPQTYMYTCVLCCFALFVCLTLLASFFLPSHLSFKNMYIKCKIIQNIPQKFIYIYNVHVCVAYTTVMFTRTYLVLILEEERSWCTQLLSSELQSVPSAKMEMPTIFLVLQVKTEHGPSQTCSCTCTCIYLNV